MTGIALGAAVTKSGTVAAKSADGSADMSEDGIITSKDDVMTQWVTGSLS